MRDLVRLLRMSETHPAIAVQNLSYSFGQRKVLRGISFSIRPGQCVMLLGPNGAGKTTLFSLICRLLAMQQGEIRFAGKNIEESNQNLMRKIGIVFQQSALDIDLSVKQNLAYFGGLHGMARDKVLQRSMDVATTLQISDRLDEKVRNLNGGHRRRVEIARALMTNPEVLLLDEPTVGLDISTRRSLIELLHNYVTQQNTAVLWATHLADEVREQDTLLILSDGNISAQGSVTDVLKAASANNVEAAYAHFTGRKAT